MHANLFKTESGLKTRASTRSWARSRASSRPAGANGLAGRRPPRVHRRGRHRVPRRVGGRARGAAERALHVALRPAAERSSVARPRVPRGRADASAASLATPPPLRPAATARDRRHRADRRVHRPGGQAGGRRACLPATTRTPRRSAWRPSGRPRFAAAGSVVEAGRGGRARCRCHAGRHARAAGRDRSRGGGRRHGDRRRLDEGPTLRARVEDRTRYIGGHPVCGSEARGPGHASAELFEGATWFLTPVAETEPERYKELHGFVGSLGAVPVAIDPAAHDRLLALTSHLPHALANVVLNHAGSLRVRGHEPLAAAGGSLRDMTRVAGVNPRIWIDIFLDNAEELRAALVEHRRRVEELEQALAVARRRVARSLDRRGGGETGDGCSRRLSRTWASSSGCACMSPTARECSPGSRRRSEPSRSTSRTSSSSTSRPSGAGRLSVLVAGEQEARRAAELLEAQGYSVIVSPAFETSDRRHGRAGRVDARGRGRSGRQVDLAPGPSHRRDR